MRVNTLHMPPDQQFARHSEKRSSVSDRSVPILAAKDVTHAFGPVTVLHSINIDFLPGEVHAIVGENGAGKSTLMKILSGIIRPSLGEVLYSQ